MRRFASIGIALVVLAIWAWSALANHSWWPIAVPAGLVFFFFAINAIFKTPPREVTPQQFADELEKHLLGHEGPYDWDNTTSFALADAKLNALVARLPDFDRLDTPEKTEGLRQIIEALQRGEYP